MSSPETDRLTVAYRRQMLALRALTLKDHLALWPNLNFDNLDSSFPAWLAAMRALVARDRGRATGLAAGYLRAFRAAEKAAGTLVLVPAPPVIPEQLETSLRVTGPVAFKVGVRAGQMREQAAKNAFVMSSGALSKLVLDAGRSTLVESVRADSAARGWARVASANCCSFCAMLATRGPVYKSDTAGFQAHGSCACSPEPVYSDWQASERVQRWTDTYKESTRGLSGDKALAAFRRNFTA